MNVAFAKFVAQGQQPPKVGTPTYTQLRDQAVTFLVQEDELQQEGKKLGVSVSQKDVDDRLAQIKKSYGEKKFAAALKSAHITLPEYELYSLRPTLLGEKLESKVTQNVKISQSDAQKYYSQNKSSFATPETREVRHILVSTKALANQIESKLKNGGDFAALAKRYSRDTVSAQQGGKLCVAHGATSGACIQTVPPFDKAAFSLKTHEISQPVHSVDGWHVIQALDDVTPAHTQTFKQVQAQIQLNLAQQKKQVAWSNYLAKVKKDYNGKVHYQNGYAPAATTTTALAPTTTG
jgi:foldase protein PrsA